MRHLFIINPKAGSKDRSRMVMDTIKRRNPQNHEIYVTHCAKDAVGAVYDRLFMQEDEHTRVYACGGDGTFNEVVTGILKSGNKNCSVAIIPIGSGNDFIKSFPQYTASDFRDIRKLLLGDTVPVDVMQVSDSKTNSTYYCINMASAGFDAGVAEGMDKYRRIVGGKASYNVSLAESFLKYKKYSYKVYLDGENIFGGERTCMFVLAGNGNVYGGAYRATPYASVNDGLIDFITIDFVNRMKLLQLIGVYKKGEHIEKEPQLVTFRRCKSIKLETAERVPLNVDGEIILVNDPCIEIIPQAINFVLPGESEKQI